MSTGRRSVWAAGPLRLWLLMAAGPVAFALGGLTWLGLQGTGSAYAGAALLAGGLGLWLLALRYLALIIHDGLELNDRIRAALGGRIDPGELTRGLREPLLGALAYSFGRLLAQRNRAARAEAEQRSLLRAVLDGIPSGVLVIGPARDVRLVNLRLLELLNPAVRHPEGRYYGLVVDDARVAAAVERVLAGEPVAPFEVERKDGGQARTLWVSVSPFAPTGFGDDRGAIAVFQDVTELRRLERSRRDLVAHVSHELKTPVAAIVGLAETLAAGEAEPEEGRRFAELLRREAQRVGRLVDDLLRLARLESPDFTPRLEDVDAGELVRAVADRFALAARRRGQALELEIPEGPVPLRADPELLEQALANLVDNATRYTPEGGRIRIALRAEPDAVVFLVRDDGPGIAPEHQPRLFERFYRPDEGRSRRHGGTGLGLAIVKHVAQVHGGSVGVESAPGEGATFWIRLPRGPAAAGGQTG